MEKEIIARLHRDFEQSVYRDQDTGMEFWLARELQGLLGYDEWRNFLKVIEKASFLLGRQMQKLEQLFASDGGFTERLYKVRTEARKK
jgi:DNA-damage-inducible protein D